MTYDLFISYAHVDNAQGWVTRLCDALLADHARYRSGEVLTPFLDTHSILEWDDWEHHILRSLQESRLFLAVLSPGWFTSPFCRRELREYLDRQARHQLSGDHVAPVHFIEAPHLAEDWIDDPDIVEEVAWCRRQLLQAQVRLEPWFPAAEDAPGDDVVAVRLAGIAERVMPSVQDRLDRARLAEAVEGNVRAVSPTFVGRGEQLRALHDAAALSAPGTVALLHGPGGFGKTELAVAYANSHRHEYGAGVWQVAAEGRSELLPAIGTLAREVGVSLTDEERADEALAGRAVLAHLRGRVLELKSQASPAARPASVSRQAALLVLDNLDDPGLLGAGQRDQINAADWGWLRIVATSRKGPEEFGGPGRGIKAVEVGPLSEGESLELLREHQPVRGPGGTRSFSDARQEAAAREIVRILGGLTLVVEQVAVHLGVGRGFPLNYVEPTEYLAQLRTSGVLAIDEHVIDEQAEFDSLRHQEKIMDYVMDTALAELPDDAVMALRVAALAPPDGVPWPWVDAVVTPRGAATPPDRIRQILTGRRLLTPTATDELLRIHRLHAAHLAASAAQFEPDLVALIGEVVESTAPDGAAQVWQLRAVLDAALPRLGTEVDEATRAVGESDSDTRLAGLDWGDFIQAAYSYLGAAVLPLAEALVSARRALYNAEPDNRTYQRDLAIGLGTWAWLVQNWDRDRADTYYHESVDLHRALYNAEPDNRTYQRDLAIGLGDWCVFRERSGRQVEVGTWREACELWTDLAHALGLQPDEEQYRSYACTRASAHSAAVEPEPDDDPGAMLDDSFLEGTGLAGLPDPYRHALLKQVTQSLEERVGGRIAASLTDDQLQEFERLMESGDQEGALGWLQGNAPDYADITRQVMVELQDELRANAAEILAAAEGDEDGSDPAADESSKQPGEGSS